MNPGPSVFVDMSIRVNPGCEFIIQLDRERPAEPSGVVTHVSSARASRFRSCEELLEFVKSFAQAREARMADDTVKPSARVTWRSIFRGGE
jgi:hypothetical protein